jgi:hypothetical protein
MEEFISIEGSAELATHARESINSVSADAIVVNALFDDALDDLLPNGLSNIGYAWIDGHHERLATMHYLDRLIPVLERGAVVLFDDISWSPDMRHCWQELAGRLGFSHTIDLGKLGIGMWDGDDTLPRKWDLRSLIGHDMKVRHRPKWSKA